MSASHPSGAPFRTGPTHRRGRVSPRVALRACLVAVAMVVLLVVATACGNAELPTAPPALPTPPPATAPPPAPTTTTPPPTTTTGPTTEPGTGSPTPSTGGEAAPGSPTTAPRAGGGSGSGSGSGREGGSGGTAAGTPIWPATDAASARNLQKQVDGGRQPWLLDPTEVATSYSGVALNYRDPSIFPIRPGVIDVQDGATRNKATITLAQTVRQGDGGIWLVTGVRRR